MSYKWYVVHVYSGSEKRVKETIEEQMKLPDYGEVPDYPKYNLFKYTLDLIKDTQEFLEKK